MKSRSSSQDAEELQLAVGELTLAARAWGPADGRPVLALHGWLDNAASFDGLAPCLPDLRLVALDLPGHGRSDHRPSGNAYHFIDYPADIVGAADALGWTQFALLGHSLGGAIATFVAGACPHRVERLALIEALGPLSAPAEETAPRLAQSLAPEPAAARRRGPRVYTSLEQAIEARRAVGPLGEAAARLLVARALVDTGDGLRWRSDLRLRRPSPYRLTEAQVQAMLAAIEADSALILADDGLLARDPAMIERRLAAMQSIAVHRLPGQHHLHLDDPEATAAVLRPFLLQ